jgi:diguanylate cyclase (GGDEF)-like protein
MRIQRLFDPASEPYFDLLLFDGAVAREVLPALARSPVYEVDPGEVVLDVNQPNTTFYVVLRGTLRVDLPRKEADTNVHLGRGECVGEISVIDGSLTSASVRAVDACELLALQGTDVLNLAGGSHAVARNLLRILSQRVRGTNVLLREEVNVSEALRRRSMTDALTGLYNRGWLDDMLRRLTARAEQGGAPFALLVIDVDHFKTFNDTWGHLVGDRVLQQVAEALRATLRPTDFAARFGGEEFAVLLPAVSGPQNAARVADRICNRVRKPVPHPDGGGSPPHVTVSIGVAAHQRGEDAEALFRRADELLYRAKNEGRDRVVF